MSTIAVVIKLCVLVPLLLVLLLVTNNMLANYWAAGGPPNKNPELYVWRGNVCAATAAGILVVCVIVILLPGQWTRKR